MSAPQIPSGTVIAGKYTVGTCLGFGGSSATYHAAMAGNREVCVKLYDPAIQKRADAMKELEQAYAGTNALSSDIVAHVLDAGYDPGTGAPFSVTERISHASIAQFVAQRPMTPDEVCALLRSLGRVMDLAHQRRLWHHALKPTNVFVNVAQGYLAKVTDFGGGIARTAAPSQEGYALAAPWLSPEQAQNAQAGPGADVFAAALLAFYALTGRPYWLACQGTTPDYAGWQRELLSPRTPPSARALQLGVTLSSEFDSVIGRALVLDPRERFSGVGEFAAAFENIVNPHAPESAATMAFPAMGSPDYPPPPPPMSPSGQEGYAQMPPAPRPNAGGYAPPLGFVPAPSPSAPTIVAVPQPSQQPMYAAQQQAPVYAQQPMAPQQQHPLPIPPSSYPGTSAPAPAPMGRDAPAFQTQHSVGMRADLGAPRAPTSTKVAPVLVALVSVMLIAGAAAAYVMIGRRPGDAANGKTAASGGPVNSGAPVAAGSADPNASSSATTGGDGADAGVAGASVEVSLQCEPACDAIKIDDQSIADPAATVNVEPGRHTVVVSKDGYTAQTDVIVAVAGVKISKHYRLVAVNRNPNPSGGNNSGGPVNGPTAKPKDCGKFLKRCDGK